MSYKGVVFGTLNCAKTVPNSQGVASIRTRILRGDVDRNERDYVVASPSVTNLMLFIFSIATSSSGW